MHPRPWRQLPLVQGPFRDNKNRRGAVGDLARQRRRGPPARPQRLQRRHLLGTGVRARALVALLERGLADRRGLAASERGQGTVEYVGLILLVSMLMVGMVAAMKGFNAASGTEIAEVIIDKIKQAVNAITFR